MKKPVMVSLLLAAACLALWGHGNEARTAEATVKGKKISIKYFSPHLKGRDMLSQLQPGMEWRMGADAPTTLITESDLSIGGTVVPKGSYSLIAKYNGSEQWTLIFSSDPQIRGTRRDAAKDVASMPLSVGQLQESVEHMNIELKAGADNSAQFTLAWGNSVLSGIFNVAG